MDIKDQNPGVNQEIVDWYSVVILIIGAVVTLLTLIIFCLLHYRKKANLQFMSDEQVKKVKDWRWKMLPILIWAVGLTIGAILSMCQNSVVLNWPVFVGNLFIWYV